MKKKSIETGRRKKFCRDLLLPAVPPKNQCQGDKARNLDQRKRLENIENAVILGTKAKKGEIDGSRGEVPSSGRVVRGVSFPPRLGVEITRKEKKKTPRRLCEGRFNAGGRAQYTFNAKSLPIARSVLTEKHLRGGVKDLRQPRKKREKDAAAEKKGKRSGGG